VLIRLPRPLQCNPFSHNCVLRFLTLSLGVTEIWFAYFGQRATFNVTWQLTQNVAGLVGGSAKTF
jgi:hypothetical protein